MSTFCLQTAAFGPYSPETRHSQNTSLNSLREGTVGVSNKLFAIFVITGIDITVYSQAKCGRQAHYIITGKNALWVVKAQSQLWPITSFLLIPFKSTSEGEKVHLYERQEINKNTQHYNCYYKSPYICCQKHNYHAADTYWWSHCWNICGLV